MSHYDYSKNAVVLTSSSRFDMAIKSALNKAGIVPITDIPNLSSLSTISRVLQTTRNTAFIRAELYKFIQAKGYPYMVVLDMRLDVGLEKSDDPDNMKIFRAFLISYLVFSMGRGFDKLHLNIMLLFDEADTEIAGMLGKKPDSILSVLYTRNEKINELIEKMKADTSLFYRIFTLKFVAKSDIHRTIDDEVNSFKLAIEGKKKIREKAVKKQLSAVKNDEKEPASVYFMTEKKLYINASASDEDPPFSIETGEAFVVGHWTAHTAKVVSNRLKASISVALKEKSIKAGDPLFIVLPEKCIIDGTVASVLAGIVVTDLAKLPNVKVKVSRFNQATLRESQGFNMIKEYCFFED